MKEKQQIIMKQIQLQQEFNFHSAAYGGDGRVDDRTH